MVSVFNIKLLTACIQLTSQLPNLDLLTRLHVPQETNIVTGMKLITLLIIIHLATLLPSRRSNWIRR